MIKFYKFCSRLKSFLILFSSFLYDCLMNNKIVSVNCLIKSHSRLLILYKGKVITVLFLSFFYRTSPIGPEVVERRFLSSAVKNTAIGSVLLRFSSFNSPRFSLPHHHLFRFFYIPHTPHTSSLFL